MKTRNLRKINILLRAFEAAKKRVEYYALDLSLSELRRTFAQLDTNAYHYVNFQALHGTYDDALSWLKKSRRDGITTCVMTMGSSIGNFTREGAAQFLASFKNALTAPDLVLVGLDGCQQPERVFRAYNDSQHTTERFYRNGLAHANHVLGYEAFKQDEWMVEGFYDEKSNRHQASYVALSTITNRDFSFAEGEKIHFEDAYKYAEVESDQLWHAAGLIPQMTYSNSLGDYCKYLSAPCLWLVALAPADASPKSSIFCLQPWSTSQRNRQSMLQAPFLRSMIGISFGVLGTLSPGRWFPRMNS